MLSLPHLIVIFVVALIVFGPEKLPELARNLGKLTAEFRRITWDMRTSFEDQMRQLEMESADLERKKRELAAAQANEAQKASAEPPALPDATQAVPAPSNPSDQDRLAPRIAPPLGEAPVPHEAAETVTVEAKANPENIPNGNVHSV